MKQFMLHVQIIILVFSLVKVEGNGCYGKWKEFESYCYLFYREPHGYTWGDARSYCQTFGGNLASIINQKENDFINSEIQELQEKENLIYDRIYWIGLNDIKNESKFEWSDGLPFSFTKWQINEPNNLETENCVAILYSSWNDWNCNRQHSFICKIGKGLLPEIHTSVTKNLSVCELGWISWNTSCYLINSALVATAQEAQSYCQSLTGNLLVIDSLEENEFIANKLSSQNFTTNFYIGLQSIQSYIRSYIKCNESFKWVGGKALDLSVSYWDTNQPKCFANTCVLIDLYTKLWKTVGCDLVALGHICEKNPAWLTADPDEWSTLTERTKELFNLNVSSYYPDDEKIVMAAQAMSDSSFFTNKYDVALVADILIKGSLMQATNRSNTIMESVLDLVNTVLDVNQKIILNAQNVFSSSNKILEALDIFAQKLPHTQNNKSFNYFLKNIGMNVIISDNAGITLLSFENEQKEMMILKNEEVLRKYNKDILVTMKIPKEVLAKESITYSFVYRKSYLFMNNNGSLSISDSSLIQSKSNHNDSLTITRRSIHMKITSVIISVSIVNQTLINLKTPVFIEFQKPKDEKGFFNCYFWNITINAWSNDGCNKFKESDLTVSCLCDHLTNFALVLDTSQSRYNPFELKLITWIGCGVSIVALMFTVLVLLARRNLRKKRKQKVHIFLCISLLALMILFLTGAEKKSSSVNKCHAIAAGLHYFVLTTFCWMAVEGVNLYQEVTILSRLESKYFLIKSSLFAWGAPLIIVGYIAAFHRKFLGDSIICTVHGYPFYFGLLLPVVCVILLNLVILILVLMKITKRDPKVAENFKDKGAIFQLKRSAWAVFVLSFFLGTTWLFAVLALGELTIAFQWIFCISTSLQGFFFFLHHIALDPSAQNEVSSCIARKHLSKSSQSNENKREKNATALTLTSKKCFDSNLTPDAHLHDYDNTKKPL